MSGMIHAMKHSSRPSVFSSFLLAGIVFGGLFLASPPLEAQNRKERKAAAAAAAKAEEEALARLPEKYRQWLLDVEFIISKEERQLFLELEKDYLRDAFIERFWKVRDPIDRTGRNEFREEYEARLELARQFGVDDRARVLVLNGFPAERFELRCNPTFWPLEVWYYAGSERTGAEFLLIFYKFGGGKFVLWDPMRGIDVLYTGMATVGGSSIDEACLTIEDADILKAAIASIQGIHGSAMNASLFQNRISTAPEAPEKEWVATFSTYTTELPEGAATFEASLEYDYPGRHQARTVLQGAVLVDPRQIEAVELGTARSYNLMLNGEVLLGDELFENFRYKYDFPALEGEGGEGADVVGDDAAGAPLPLVFQRYLRPGEYRLIVKVEDLASGRFYRHETPLVVPQLEAAPPPAPSDPLTARLLAEANAVISSGENTIQIVPPMGTWQTGLIRVDTLTTGPGIEKVTFFLDNTPILTKNRAPFDVELDFGQVPRALTLRVEAYDSAGNEVANDEALLNAGQHRFGVRLVEPRRSKTYKESLRARADTIVPEGELVERVEFYLNETLVATVYQPPYIQPILLPESEEVAYVRAVAYTPDGNSTEDVVFINAPDYLENIEVDFVELFTAVLDKNRRPVEGLEEGDFTVLEDGKEQQILRFERVRDLPIHVGVMLDVSASMVEELEATQAAALQFFEEAVTPRDRAALITFNDHPHLAAKFSNDVQVLAAGLAGLKAERGTSLYDSLIFGLYYFNGIKGQRAILLLSDGKDESSRYEWDDALEYARRAGVAIYSIGLKLTGSKQADARRKLERLADETGGRSFFIDDENELAAIYDTIQQELRSRYLLAYQSSQTGDSKAFRTIDVEVDRDGVEALTLRGYYP